jgi:FlaA1/EpsC-like NDP-sugar epimerase
VRARQVEESGEPVVIWGAGALTSRLLCDTRLAQVNLRAVIDRNKNLQGKSLLGVAISAPESVMQHAGATVFIASTTYAEEIKQTLLNEYGWTGRIISLALKDSEKP